MQAQTLQPQVGLVADTPSGLGGIYTVKLLEKLEENTWHVQVLNPGFTKVKFRAQLASLKNIRFK